MVAPPLVHHSAMAPCFYGGLGFFHDFSKLWRFLIPSIRAVFSYPMLVPFPELLSKPHIVTPSSTLLQQIHNLDWGTQGCGTDHQCSYYSVLPSRLVDALSSKPRKVPLSPSWSPYQWVGFHECRNLSCPSAPLQGCRFHPIPHPSPHIFFPFYWLHGFTFALLGIWGPLLVFNRCFVRIVPFVCTYTCTYIHICIYAHTYMYVYICTHIHMCAYICTHIHGALAGRDRPHPSVLPSPVIIFF